MGSLGNCALDVRKLLQRRDKRPFFARDINPGDFSVPKRGGLSLRLLRDPPDPRVSWFRLRQSINDLTTVGPWC